MFLNCHSYFSLRYGTLSPERLVKYAYELGIDRLALTDINNTSGVFDFIRLCRQYGILPIVGMEFRDDNNRFIGLAQNHEGFYELNKYLSHHTRITALKPFEEHHFSNVSVIYPLGQRDPDMLKDYEFIGIHPRQAGKLLSNPLSQYRDKCVMLHPVTFANKYEYKIHKILRAVDENTTVAKIDEGYAANADEMFQPNDQLITSYDLVPEVVRNTENLLSHFHDDYDLIGDKNRRSFTNTVQEDYQLLDQLARDGFPYRYNLNDQKAWERLERELTIIEEMGFCTYFLITYDIVQYGKSKGFYHVGRGSGANSIVAYCLGITDVDPLELDLYFERFINQYRTSPPDFDIDFSWDERDEVIEYVFNRYGRDYTCLLATYSTFKGRSIIREFGKAFGLPKAEIDAIVEDPYAKDQHHGLAHKILEYGNYVADFPNQLSIHAGGILITEQPIYYYTPLQMMPKGFPISHFDMHVAEDINLHKYDVLSQRGIGHIKMAADVVKENQGLEVDVHQINQFKEDDKVSNELRNGNTLGCFYIESPAMRGLLSKLQCDTYTSLVAASSIIRPGVAKSGMMKEYIKRHKDPENFEYLHETYAEHLKETYGIMVYQEDVIKIAHHYGGLDLGESDILRRIMSGKKHKGDRFEQIKSKFFRNCREMSRPEAITNEVWRQISSFAGYSFCKAHSASFAVESFQSLFLKTYYPLEFLVAVINNFGGFYRTEIYVQEALKAGATIEAPCVNNSDFLTRIDGKTIYLGLIHLRDLASSTAMNLIEERENHGKYLSFADFIQRTNITKEQLNILIRIGAFRFTGQPKKTLLWQKNLHLEDREPALKGLPALEGPTLENAELPPLEDSPHEQAFEELDLLGFPIENPFNLLQTNFRGEIMAKDMSQQIGKTVRMVGYYVTRKNVKTVNKKLMNFGCFLDVEGAFFDTIHFPPVLKQYPFQGIGCYLLLGRITEEFGFPMMEVEKMAKLPMVADPRYE